jgi:hypothetical protein
MSSRPNNTTPTPHTRLAALMIVDLYGRYSNRKGPR